MCQVAPAGAQIIGSASVESDLRFRGYSVSSGDPAATIDLGYDHESGLYVNGSATVGFDQSDPALLAYQLNAGYAARITPSVSIDAGVVRSWYTRHSGTGDTHYTEAYLGVTAHGIASRVYYSPDYLRPGVHTLYAEVESTLRLAPKWRLTGHACKCAAQRPERRVPLPCRANLRRRYARHALGSRGRNPVPSGRDGRPW